MCSDFGNALSGNVLNIMFTLKPVQRMVPLRPRIVGLQTSCRWTAERRAALRSRAGSLDAKFGVMACRGVLAGRVRDQDDFWAPRGRPRPLPQPRDCSKPLILSTLT